MSNSHQAICWMLTTGFLAICILSIVKHLGGQFHPFQMMFFYCALGACVFAPFALRQWNAMTLKDIAWKWYVLRAVLEFAAFSLSFYALQYLPLPTQTAITFSSPIYASLFAILLLKERSESRKWLALALGMVGVCVISNPFDHAVGALSVPALVAIILSAVIFGFCGVLIKRMTRNTSPLYIAFFMLSMTAIVSLPFALPVWKPVAVEAYAWLAIFGLMTASVQYCVARALTLGQVTVLVPLAYVNLIWSAIIAYIFFSEVISLQTIIGSAVVVAAALLTVRKSAVKD